MAFFRATLSDAGVETSADALEGYNVDWLRKYRGQATVALRPKSTNEVAAVMRYCNERRYEKDALARAGGARHVLPLPISPPPPPAHPRVHG